MAAFASPEDIVARGRSLTSEQEIVAETLLEDASEKLRVLVTTLDYRIADGTLNPVLPRQVVVRMVIDALNNPGRLKSEQVEDVSFTYDLQQLRQQMHPSADELAMLRPRTSTPGKPRGIGRARTRPVL